MNKKPRRTADSVKAKGTLVAAAAAVLGMQEEGRQAGKPEDGMLARWLAESSAASNSVVRAVIFNKSLLAALEGFSSTRGSLLFPTWPSTVSSL